ncbi:hypothetical protein vseg_007460 [Gypsophila vaccaria]
MLLFEFLIAIGVQGLNSSEVVRGLIGFDYLTQEYGYSNSLCWTTCTYVLMMTIIIFANMVYGSCCMFQKNEEEEKVKKCIIEEEDVSTNMTVTKLSSIVEKEL